MLFEDTGWGKFSKFMSDHILSDENRDERTSVVDIESMTNEVGSHCGTARPGFDRLLGVVLVEFIDLFEEFPLDERTFFEGACHDKLFLFAALHDEAVALFMFVAGFEAFGELTPWAHWVMASATPLTLTLSTTHRVINRIHRHTASLRANTEPTRTTSFSTDHIHVLYVSNLANGCIALFIDAAQFARSHLDESISAFTVTENCL